MKHISIIILSFNSEEYIKKGYLKTVLKNSYVKNFRKSLIVFDNGSVDNTLSLLKRKYPQIDIIYSFRNEGYTKGVNYALRYAYKKYGSDYFIILDHDAFVEKDYLKKLVEFMEEHKEAGFVQPLVFINPKKKEIYSAGHRYNRNGTCFPIHFIKRKKSFSEILSGSILGSIVSKKALEKVGLLDETFKIYYESSDWGFRFRKKGLRNYCLYTSVIYHDRNIRKHNMTQFYYILRNRIILWKKHYKKLFKSILKEYKDELKKLEKKISRKKGILNLSILVKYKALKDGILITRNYQSSIPKLLGEYKFDFVIDSHERKYF